ncbi:hypothetical protein RFI_12121, partial [Reticulomyxa filosa]
SLEDPNDYVAKQFQKFGKKEREYQSQFDFDPEKLDDVFDTGISLQPQPNNSKSNTLDDMDIDIDLEMHDVSPSKPDPTATNSSKGAVSNFLED